MPKHVVSFIVENKPGVLFKVSNLFRRRGYNIDSITVGTLQDSELSRMTVTIDADSKILNQIVEQLDKMVEVIKIKRFDPIRTITRELLLIKLNTIDPMVRQEALEAINDNHGLILDIEPETLVAEITGEPQEIDKFLNRIKNIEIRELSRTGATALEKGPSTL
ncbi:acetolactate synthase small subunit [Candidatus Bathyarchaeota archaeon]|nr:acetolactate synthase small subunit [Candidatus Bathyarchaeota archaeon]